MPAIEDGANVGAGTGGRDKRPFGNFNVPAPKAPERAGGGRPLFAPPPVAPAPAAKPAPNLLSGFDRSTLTKLTPFAMPKPVEPVVEQPKNYQDHLRAPEQPTYSISGVPMGPRPEMREAKDKVEYGKERTRRTVALSWEDYQKLSQDQRAAVDFNTLLVKAREKDLNTDYQQTPGQQAEYDKAVKEMFGADGGSETYAPETVSVLRQIDYQDTGEDLDNFLGLKTAISARELKDFDAEVEKVTIPMPLSSLTGVEKLKVPLADSTEELVTAQTSALQESMAKAGKLLQSFQASAAVQRNADLQFFGGTMNDPKVAFGFGDDRMGSDVEGIDSWFKEAYNSLALKENDANLGLIFNKIEEKLNSPQMMQAFTNYVDLRTQQAMQYGAPVADVEGNVRSPEEFRKLFGFDQRGAKNDA